MFWCHQSDSTGIASFDFNDLNSFTITANPGGGKNADFFQKDKDYIYGTTNENPCRFLRWRLSDMGDTASAAITGTNVNARGCGVSENFLYTFVQGTPDKLYRINKKTMATVETANSAITGSRAQNVFVCSGKIYVVEYSTTPGIQIFSETPFAYIERKTNAFALPANYWDSTLFNCPVWRKDTISNTPLIFVP